MNNSVVWCEGTFFYNNREVMLVEVLESYQVKDKKTIVNFKKGERVVTYYPNKYGIIENIATGEKYVYGTVIFNGTDRFIAPFRGSFLKSEYSVAVESPMLTDEDKFEFNRMLAENNITSEEQQRRLFDSLLRNKGSIILNNWIEKNCNNIQRKNK